MSVFKRTKVSKERRPNEDSLSQTQHIHNDILKGTSICLTGLSSGLKSRLHELVESMGGRYTRELHTKNTTHLIADKATGEKFEQAIKYPHIEIVSPEWIDVCALKRMRVSTEDYLLVSTSTSRAENCEVVEASRMPPLKRKRGDDPDARNGVSRQDAGSASTPLEMTLRELLCEGRVPPNPLFSNCHFFLVGFQTDAKKDLCRLIRRAMGTVYWDVDSRISHIIVSEDTDMKLRSDVSNFCRYCPNHSVSMICPEWVTSCLENKILKDPKDYPPRKRVVRLKGTIGGAQTPGRSNKEKIFNGLLFQIRNVDEANKRSDTSSPIVDMVSFSEKKVEKVIRTNGGELLSEETIRELIGIHTRGSKSQSPRTTTSHRCYVVHLSGSFDLGQTIRDDPLLHQISKHSCYRIIPVNAIWLQACEASRGEIAHPERHSLLFQPQKWPLRKLQRETRLEVTVTSFQGVERFGLKHMFIAIGATYTDNMTKKNTHLICPRGKAAGSKYNKAVEWGLQVVSIEWLYFIMEHGYLEGCEAPFSLLAQI